MLQSGLPDYTSLSGVVDRKVFQEPLDLQYVRAREKNVCVGGVLRRGIISHLRYIPVY